MKSNTSGIVGYSCIKMVGTGVLLVLLATPFASAQQTIYVDGATGNDAWNGLCETWDGGTCGPKATIQAGVDVALAGDTVVLADGTYAGVGNKNISIVEPIAVRSASGHAYACVIDCEGDGRGFNIESGEIAGTSLDGLKIINGSQPTDEGGGVRCYHCDCQMSNCEIVNCAARTGGAVSCLYADIALDFCVLKESSASQDGGGLNCYGGSAQLTDCTVQENFGVDGGGIYAMMASLHMSRTAVVFNAATMGGGIFFQPAVNLSPESGVTWDEQLGRWTDCTVSYNTATYSGGGMHVGLVWDYMGVINCNIDGNSSDGNGGAISHWKSEPWFINCRIRGNTAANGGAVAGGRPYLVSTLLEGNSATGDGGAVLCDGGDPRIINCALVNNTAGGDGGGVHAGSWSEATIDNSILWGNNAVRGDQLALVAVGDYEPTAIVRYCDLEGGVAAVHEDAGSTLTWGAGNIDEDPHFADEDGPDDDPLTWPDNNYRLLADSPCIDAADGARLYPDVIDADENGCRVGPSPFDLDGNARCHDQPAADTGRNCYPWAVDVPDMGPYEFGSTTATAIVCYADLDCDGGAFNFDIDPFVLALTSSLEAAPFDSYYAAYPDCNHMHADVNRDGVVNLFDIDVFVQVLTGELP